jgi:hypothetical protein
MSENLPDGINQINDDGDVVVRDDLPDAYDFTGNTIRNPEEDAKEDTKFVRSKVARKASKIIFTPAPAPANVVQQLDDNIEDDEGIEEEELLEGTSAAGKKRSFRMAEALEKHGFAPESYRALTWYSLREATTSISGSAKVFNVIYQRQLNILKGNITKTQPDPQTGELPDTIDQAPVDPNMPKKTMFVIAKEYEGFIKRARTAQSSLAGLTQYLEHEDPSTPLAETRVFEKKAWMHEGILYQAVVTLQLMANEDALAAGKTEKLPKLQEYFSSERDVTDTLDEDIVHEFTVGEVLERAKEGIERHKKARQYWIEQLQEVIKFGGRGNYAALAAKKILVSLNVIDPTDDDI